MITNPEEISQQRVVLVGLENKNIDYEMAELRALAAANNLDTVATEIQNLDRPNPATYFGKGKVEELAERVEALEADLVLTNDELSPSQIRNLEHELHVTVLDRTGLILDIFAQRAQNKVSKLQVQLAQLKYQLPRLRTSMAIRLDQQGGAGGGSFTSRGAGETKIELSRRVIESQMIKIKKELAQLQKSEDTRTKRRKASQQPVVALVGYTNAGKSTIMNQLLERYGVTVEEDETKQVFEADMLFATLTTTLRQINLPDKNRFLLNDTVGFVSNLPHDLVEAFKSTLQAAAEADLLLQVVDISDEHYQDMMATTEATLKEIGVIDIPMLTIFNKADQTDLTYPTVNGEELTISAKDEASLDQLIAVIEKKLFAQLKETTLLIPFDRGDLVSELNEQFNVLTQSYVDEGTQLKLMLAEPDIERLQDYIVR